MELGGYPSMTEHRRGMTRAGGPPVTVVSSRERENRAITPGARTAGGTMSHDQIRRLGVSPRQAQVAALLLQGRQDKQIASELGITARTVRAHLDELCDRFSAHGRVELAVQIMSALSFHGAPRPRQK